MFRLRFFLLFPFVALICIAALVLGGRTAKADKKVTIDPISLGAHQYDCSNVASASALRSATIVLEGTPHVMPDVTVEFDRNGDGHGDWTHTIAPQIGSSAGSVRYEVPGGVGFIRDASAVLPDDWDGTLRLAEYTCDRPLPAPANACAHWPGRATYRFDALLGDPRIGLSATMEIPLPNFLGGVFDVTLQSFDPHSEHGGQGQEHEQWYLLFRTDRGTVLTQPIADIPDAQDTLNQKVGRITLPSGAVTMVLIHERSGVAGEADRFETPESVTAVCIALDVVEELPESSSDLPPGRTSRSFP